MKSATNWALLGVVIERPGHADELARRLEGSYRGALSLSGTSHLYAALGALTSRSLIEELPATGLDGQAKPHYRATVKGLESYGEWFVGELREDRRRQRLLVLQVAALTGHPKAALEILGRYEDAWLEEGRELPAAPKNRQPDDAADCAASLLAEEERLVSVAKLSWVRYARRRLNDLVPPPARGD